MAHILPPSPLDILELLDDIVSFLDDPHDLINVACTTKRFTDLALRALWREPMFDTSPLLSMVHLFPDDISAALEARQSANLRIPATAFVRFDYYAHLIHSLTLWHHGGEAFVAAIITRSRPGVWIFPSLDDLHLGASGEEIEMLPIYLTPTLRFLYLNHWDGLHGREISTNAEVKKTLARIYTLPRLATLDLADALFTPLETDIEVVHGFAGIASRLESLISQSFLTLPIVFDALSWNPNLCSVFLNTTSEGDAYISLDDIIMALHQRFPALRTLGLYCTIQQAVQVFSHVARPFPNVNLKISTAMDVQDLHDLVTALLVSNAGLRFLRICSAGNVQSTVDPPPRLSEVIAPLRGCRQLRKLEIILSFDGEQMMLDHEMTEYFRAWPELEVCTIMNDAEGDLIAVEGEQTSFGLTLQAVLAAARYCPHLSALALPFVDTSIIPDVGNLPRSRNMFYLHLSNSHVHNHTQVQEFVSRLWSTSEIMFSGCDHSPGLLVNLSTAAG